MGGTLIALLDGIDAVVYFGWRGASPVRIFQAVAAGLVGRSAAFEGGAATFGLGVAIHLFVATSIFAVYYFASRRLSLLLRRPVLFGPLYGCVANAVMQWVVIPFSATTPLGIDLPNLLNGFLGHALLVGLPAALIARRASGIGEPGSEAGAVNASDAA